MQDNPMARRWGNIHDFTDELIGEIIGIAESPHVPKAKRLEEALGLKVDLSLRGLGEQSVLTLEIRDFDQLDTVVDKLTRR